MWWLLSVLACADDGGGCKRSCSDFAMMTLWPSVYVCVLRVYTFSKQPPSPERLPSNYVSYSVMSHTISFQFQARTELSLSISLSISWATAVRSHLFIVRNCRITKHSEWVLFRVPSNNPCATGLTKEAIYFTHTHSTLRSSVSRNDVATVRGRASKWV